MTLRNRGNAPHQSSQPVGKVNGEKYYNASYTNYPMQELKKKMIQAMHVKETEQSIIILKMESDQ